MDIVYAKVRVTDGRTGFFKTNAAVFKLLDIEPLRRQSFLVVTPRVDIGIPDNGNSARPHVRHLGEGVQNNDNVAGGAVLKMKGPANLYVLTDETFTNADSIMTLSLRLSNNSSLSESVFGGNLIEVIERCTFDSDGVFDVNAVFTATAAATNNAQGTSVSSNGNVAMNPNYTTSHTYSGFRSYHGYQSGNGMDRGFNVPLVADKPWRIGVELEVYARSQTAYDTIVNARSNWFQCERDGSLNERSFPIELKTIPLRACDAKSMEFWDRPMTRLAQLALSKNCRTTGLHVHIGKEAAGSTRDEIDKTIRKLCWFYVYRIEGDPDAHAKNVLIAGREYSYCSDRSTINNFKDGIADFAEMIGYKSAVANSRAFDLMASPVVEKVRRGRWDINLKPIDTYGTIEFRKGDGRISKTRMAAIVTWWEQMILYCRNHSQDELDFNDFFTQICRDYPAVAYFFQQDEEA